MSRLRTPFKGLIISATGEFGKTNSIEALKRWTENNGGKWTSKVEPGITHLVCSKDNYRHKVQAVKAAESLKCPIVTWDWFEDSIHKKRLMPLRGEYLCKNAFKLAARKRQARKERERDALKKDVRRFNKGCLMAMADLYSGTSTKDSLAICAFDYFEAHSKALGKKAGVGAGADGVVKTARREPYTVYSGPQKASATWDEDTETNDEKESKAAAVDALRARMALFKKLHGVTESSFTSSTRTAKNEVPASNKQAATKSHPDTGTPSEPSKPRVSLDSKKQASAHQPVAAVSAAIQTTLPAAFTAVKARPQFHRANQSSLANHHLYRDNTGFTYNIIIVRINMQQNTNERLTLHLYESHTTPHTYALYLRHHIPAPPGTSDRRPLRDDANVLMPIGSPFAECWRMWRKIFEEKTTFKWEERQLAGVGKRSKTLAAAAASATATQAARSQRGDGTLVARAHVLADGGQPFTYQMPKEGEPTGLDAPGHVGGAAQADVLHVARQEAASSSFAAATAAATTAATLRRIS